MRFFQAAILSFLLSVPCLAQTLMPARQVSVNTSNFQYLSPTAQTAQATFAWLDSSVGPLPAAVASNVQAIASNTEALSVIPAGLAGVVTTNAAIVAYNASAHNWNFTNLVVDVFLSLLGNTNDSYRLIQDAAAFRSNFLAGFAAAQTNVAVLPAYASVFSASLSNLFATNFTLIVKPYADAVGATNEHRISSVRAELYSILRELDIGSYSPYTYVPGTYTSNWQTYIVPSNAPVGTVIEAHCWGGGAGDISSDSRAGKGGYAFGRFTVVSASVFNASGGTNASLVTNGMSLAVQVGPASGRSAVWRLGSYTNFHTMTNEILVAGGAGYYIGGYGGGTNGGRGMSYGPSEEAPFIQYGGGGGTQKTGDGAAGTGWNGTTCGNAGVRVWGGLGGGGSLGTCRRGGDGYYGGGSGWSGGGGSGFVHPSMIVSSLAEQLQPGIGAVPGTADTALYGSGGAGYDGNPGRVCFKRRLVE